jgi:3-methyladenine DNA glycosylase AlkD
MNKTDVLRQLQALGTAQNRKVYERHGIRGEQYGVSYAGLGKLKKQIGVDHALALALWATGNHDARVLATMVADPAEMDRPLLEAWVADLDNYVLTDALSGLAARSPVAQACMEAWAEAKGEWRGTAGMNILAALAAYDDALPDAYLERYLGVIEARIHGSENRVRHAMNMALIAIGVRNPSLQATATAAAGRIGKVEVNHGATSCKTPDAAAYIRKTVERKQQRRAVAG